MSGFAVFKALARELILIAGLPRGDVSRIGGDHRAGPGPQVGACPISAGCASIRPTSRRTALGVLGQRGPAAPAPADRRVANRSLHSDAGGAATSNSEEDQSPEGEAVDPQAFLQGVQQQMLAIHRAVVQGASARDVHAEMNEAAGFPAASFTCLPLPASCHRFPTTRGLKKMPLTNRT